MISDDVIKAAIAIGEEQAKRVIAFRDQELSTRALAIASAPAPSPPIVPSDYKEVMVEPLGPLGRGKLIAEGDSWFDYPFHDILRILEDHHGYDVDSVAHKGDRIEDMAYSEGQLEEFTRRLEKMLRGGSDSIPRAILLSGGGNDLAGEEFGMLLNHAGSGSKMAGINRSVAEGVINERVKMAYATIIGKITAVCQARIGGPVPVLVHGYDHPIPDGRGFLGGWWFLPGPWLEPGFREKGFEELGQRIEIAKELIDYFNKMLQDLVSLSEFRDHVHYVDLRGTVSVSRDYEDDWANELHPTEAGFKRVAARLADVIGNLTH